MKMHPLLETDTLECPHKGKVLLKSSTKDLLNIENAGVITLEDLSKASILGCTHTIGGIPTPCVKLVSIPDSIASTLLKVNGDKVVLVESITQVLTDKGFPLILQGSPKAKGHFELEQ